MKFLKIWLILSSLLMSYFVNAEEITKKCKSNNECLFSIGEDFKFSISGIGSILPLLKNMTIGDKYSAINDVSSGCVSVYYSYDPEKIVGYFSSISGEIFSSIDYNGCGINK